MSQFPKEIVPNHPVSVSPSGIGIKRLSLWIGIATLEARDDQGREIPISKPEYFSHTFQQAGGGTASRGSKGFPVDIPPDAKSLRILVHIFENKNFEMTIAPPK